MTDITQAIAHRIADRPDEAITELLKAMDTIESKHSPLYRLSDDERGAVREGLAQAERGEFVSGEQVAAYFNRHRS